MGESGSGKSTLLNLIAGLERPDAGSIILDGVNLTALDENARSIHRRTHFGFIFQAFHILPYLSVEANVALPLLLNGCANNERAQRAQAMLERVALADRTDAKPRELSGGEMQRVAIARALVHRPRLILADEPTGNLDADNAQQILSLLRQCVSQERTAVMLVTHSLLAARVADRAYRLGRSGLEPIQCLWLRETRRASAHVNRGRLVTKLRTLRSHRGGHRPWHCAWR
jgi:putative ABC transport system ATP-binding protein